MCILKLYVELNMYTIFTRRAIINQLLHAHVCMRGPREGDANWKITNI